jgi:hypothetical protein
MLFRPLAFPCPFDVRFFPCPASGFCACPLVWYGQETSTMCFFPCSLTFPLYYQGKWAETRKTAVSGRFLKGKQKVKDVSLTYKNLFLHYKQAYTRIPLAVGLQVRVGMRGPHLLFFALPYLREEAKGL